MPDIPHFAFPFDINGRAAAVVEQDSDEELVACVSLILSTQIGTRMALPDFGREDPTFVNGTAAVMDMQAAVQRYEPRANVYFDDRSNPIMVGQLQLKVRVTRK